MDKPNDMQSILDVLGDQKDQQ